jgi:hypothetical protein
MITWYCMRPSTGAIDIVECYETLDSAIAEMELLAGEDPTNQWINYVVDESGDVIATGLYGPEMELIVTCADGRRLTFPMPDTYTK